jgi:rhamnulokinase
MSGRSEEYRFLAFDIGATSGRAMVGTLQGGVVALEELTRFDNPILTINGRSYWNIFSLHESMKMSLRRVAERRISLDAIGIDTWGVDFVYVGRDGTLLGLPRSYRDPYTDGIPGLFFKKEPREKIYDITGIQVMNFNTLFQLYAAQREGFSPLAAADGILFMPDALSYLLTGKRVCEYTIATTSQLVDARTRRIAGTLLEALGLSPALLPVTPVAPGTVVGTLDERIARECGVARVPVVAVAGHDTASAVVAVPAENENFAYLSSGTWSLMGIEVPEPVINDDTRRMNFTNEGGAFGRIRLLKNITGMWLLEACRKEWQAAGESVDYAALVASAERETPFRTVIDPDDPAFAHPESMTRAITDYCRRHGLPAPVTPAAMTRCIFDSLALKYREVLNDLQALAPFRIETLHVVGGGAQNQLLNRLTAEVTGLPVVAGPVEATAFGNVLMQAKGLGIVHSLREIRDIVRRSVSPTFFKK